MSTSYGPLGTASGHGEAQGARRELFNTVLRQIGLDIVREPADGSPADLCDGQVRLLALPMELAKSLDLPCSSTNEVSAFE